MKLASEFDSFLADALVVIEKHDIDFLKADHGETGLKAMHLIHTLISRNRAFDDKDPRFVSGHWTRALPYDGRDYCWLYEVFEGCNDSHVATLLRRVKLAIVDHFNAGIRSIGWLQNQDGSVTLTPVFEGGDQHGGRVRVPREEFEQIRHSKELLKHRALKEYAH